MVALLEGFIGKEKTDLGKNPALFPLPPYDKNSPELYDTKLRRYFDKSTYIFPLSAVRVFVVLSRIELTKL